MTSIVSWPYQRTDCKYIHRLYEGLDVVADEPLKVSDYRPGRSWLTAPDILHLHWPETALDHPWYPRALLRALIVLFEISLMKLRGTTVVWTRHDDGSHRQAHPRSERFFVSLYERLTDGFIHLTKASVGHFRSSGSTHSETVIPHGIGPIGSVSETGRGDAKRELGLDEGLPVLGIVGRLQDYKNVLETIDAFASVGHGQLLIAGQPVEPAYQMELERRRSTEGLTMNLGRLSDREFAIALRACDVVLLPYSGHLNSGVAFEALATPSRIAVSESPAMAELVTLASEEWAQMIPAPPTPEVIESLLKWAEQPVPARGRDLTDTWCQVAKETWAFMSEVRE